VRQVPAYEDDEGTVWHRAKWRIRESIIDPDLMEDALRLLQAIIQISMDLSRNIDSRYGNSALPSMIGSQTGVDLAV
jgi:hypothetical protein